MGEPAPTDRYTEGTPAHDGAALGSRVTPQGPAYAILVLVGFALVFVLLACLLPLRTAVQIGADEGFEVAKATLWLKGHQLYGEVWNDQPPLHTFLVTCVLKHFSSTMLGPRLLTMGFAVVLLCSIFLICVRFAGLLAATLTGALLIASPGFLGLSSSCMLEIPSVATAVAALCVLSLSTGKRRLAPEVFGGLLFGAALQMKLVPAILLVLVPMIVWLRVRGTGTPHPGSLPSEAERRNFRKVSEKRGAEGVEWLTLGFRPGGRSLARLGLALLLFGTSLLLSYVVVDLVIERGAYLRHFQQTWASHFGGSKSFEYGSARDFPFDWSILLRNWDLTIPAAFGVVVLARRVRRSAPSALPLVWLTLTIVIFTIHKPWWPYYYVHIAIPLCWCAAAGMSVSAQVIPPALSHSDTPFILQC
jgi:hypothetical protein